MLVSKRYFAKTFAGADSKGTYLKACKWIAKHLINDKNLKDTHWKITKNYNEKNEVFEYKLELFSYLEESETIDSFCARCKEFHKLFYINQQYNCDRCNMLARNKDMEDKLIVKEHYYKGIIKG